MPAVWTTEEETFLVNFLFVRASEAGNNSSFKNVTFNSLVTAIAPLYASGDRKTIAMCRNKWTALRGIYRVIQEIQQVSGWTWKNKTGASITPATASSWDDYVKAHPKARPFRNKGWPHLAKVRRLMPAHVSGSNVYHPTTTPSTTLATSSESSSASEASTSSSDDAQEPSQSLDEPATQTESLPDNDLAENGSNQDDDEIIASSSAAPPSESRKRREPATPTKPASKRQRTTGADALSKLSDSLSYFQSAIATALAPPSSSSTPLCRAIEEFQKLDKDWLDMPAMLELINVFQQVEGAAETYLSLSIATLRQEWVRATLHRRGVLAYPPFEQP